MKYVLRRLLLCTFIIVCFATTLHGETDQKTVKAEGIAGIRNNNKALARDLAIQDALRKAVEQAVGTMISSETMVENYKVLSDKIYARTQGYIQKYNILSEKKEESLYRVVVQASVASGPLKNDLSALGLLMARKQMPRVMFMVAEQNIGTKHFSFWWNIKVSQTDLTVTENILLKNFAEKGFNIVDHAVSSKTIQLSNAYTLETMTNDTISSIGKIYNSEVVIYGKALAQLSGTVLNSSMKSAQADISLRAVNTDTGQVIASTSTHAAAVHPSEVTAGTQALKQAAASISDDLIRQIATQWQKDIGGKAIVKLVISDIETYPNLVTIKKSLKNDMRGVTGVFQREFNGGSATIDIETSESAQYIADELSVAKYKNFTLKIISISQNSITIKMITN